MRIAVVDDEQISIDSLKSICNEFVTQRELCLDFFPFSSGKAFLDAFEAGVYQIVFMDIFMEGMDGIDTAREMREKDPGCFLVFLTSSTDFMPEAFSCHAFDYVVKPFTSQRVFQVLSDAQKHFPELPPHIEIASGRQTVPLLLSDIVSVVNDAHYLDIRTKDGSRLRSRMTAEHFLQLAKNDPRFLSVNRGILVNADYISSIDKEYCCLSNGAKFPIRIRERQRLEHELHQYHFAKIRSSHCHRPA